MKNSKFVILEHLLFGFLIIGLLLSLKIIVERTSFGHRLELFVFEMLQGRLSPFDPEKELPIVVVDISKMEEDQGLKDREKLHELVAAIAGHKPRAIAVDIVFSPENKKWRTGFDEIFLDDCLKLRSKEGIPVFISVDSKMRLGDPSAWLGRERFREMAVTISVYKYDGKRVPLWAREKPDGVPLPSMSYALASTGAKRPSPDYIDWALEINGSLPGRVGTIMDIDNNVEIEYADALVNFSKLEAIYQTRLLNISAASVEEFGEKFADRIVLIGDGKKLGTFDAFSIPGRAETFPGVYLHAAAAYTLIEEPIYEFKWIVRLLWDVLFSAVILLIVAFARWKHRADEKGFDWRALERKLVWRSGFLILVAAVALVYFTHVLWLDFVFIVIALLSHGWFEHNLKLLWQRIRLASAVSVPGDPDP
jgi:CHASE2 domain-containing sensor protein